MALTAAERTSIITLTVSMFNAAPGANYLSDFTVAFEANPARSTRYLATLLENTAAFRGLYPVYQTNAEFTTSWLTTMGLQANQEAIDFVTSRLNAGQSKGSVIVDAVAAIQASTATAFAAAKAQLANKASVAENYTVTLGSSSTSLATLQGTISTVTNDTATATAAISTNTAAAATASGSGQSFTLTTGIDTSGSLVGSAGTTSTAGNDTFNGYFNQTGASTDSTLGASDIVDGGAGTDTLNVSTAGTPTTLGAATIRNFEIINLRATANTGTLALATAGITGLTEFNSVGPGTGTVTITGLNSGAAFGLTGDGATALGNVNATYVTTTATVATLNVRNGVGPSGTTAPTVAIGGTGTTSAVINSTGAANTIGALDLDTNTGGTLITTATVNASSNLTTGAWTAAALTRLNVTGTAAVNTSTTALAATVTTVDASANSGGLTVALGTAVTQTVTGGSGNDVITTGAVLTTGSVNAGAGTGHVLDVGTNVAHVNNSTLAAKYTNFEIVRIGAAALNMALIDGINAVQLTGAATLTNMTATQAGAVAARANIGNASLALANAAGTSDVLTITNGLGTTIAAATTIGTLVATGFETINLVANPGPTATSANSTTTVTAITDANLNAVNLTGTAFTFGDIATTKAVAWDASNLTGNRASTPVGLTLTTTGAAFAGSVVTGSNLRDSVIMTSSTGVTFNLGGGNDLFSTTSTLLLPSGAATDNTINAGAGTSDRLVITVASTLTDTHFTKTSGFEQLELAGGALNESVTGLGAGFLGAFATGVSVTETATQAAAQTYTWASGLYAQPVTIVHATAGTLAAVDSNQSITTGAGADNITLTATAVVGAAGAAGNISVNTGGGNDTINVNIGVNQILAVTGTRAVTINGGAGQDAITVNATHLNALAANLGNVGFVVDANQSSTTSWDTITGFLKADGAQISDSLDFTNVALTTYAASAPTGYTAGQLTVAVAATGLVTFAGTSAAGLSVQEKINAIQAVVVTNNGDSAFFIDNGSTYVFNNETAGDVVVQLIGQTGATTLATTNAVTANLIHIV